MMKNIILMLKGMIVGIANIIPGVSGGTLMIILGLYEDVIDAISHFFKNFKKNLTLLIPLGIGMVLSIALLSKVISLSLDKFPFATTFFFIGLILGGIPLLWKKVSASKGKAGNWIVFAITFSVVIIFTFLKSGDGVVNLSNLDFSGYVSLFVVGVIAASTMIIPGISGSFVLMMLGYYKPIVDCIKSLTSFENIGENLLIVIPFGLGVLIGIVLIAKLIEYLFNRYPVKTYYGVLGFVIASLVAIIKPVLSVGPGLVEVIVSILLVIIGFLIAYKLGDQ